MLRNSIATSRKIYSRSARIFVAPGHILHGKNFSTTPGKDVSDAASIVQSIDVTNIDVEMVRQVGGTFDTSKIIATSANDTAAAQAAVDAVAAVPEFSPYSPLHILMQGIDYIHITADLPWWAAIISATVAMRIVIAPIAIKSIQNSSRMAVLKPEMVKIQARFKGNTDPTIVKRQQAEIYALFDKHKVNPLRAMVMPLLQMPIFMSFFFALQVSYYLRMSAHSNRVVVYLRKCTHTCICKRM